MIPGSIYESIWGVTIFMFHLCLGGLNPLTNLFFVHELKPPPSSCFLVDSLLEENCLDPPHPPRPAFRRPRPPLLGAAAAHAAKVPSLKMEAHVQRRDRVLCYGWAPVQHLWRCGREQGENSWHPLQCHDGQQQNEQMSKHQLPTFLQCILPDPGHPRTELIHI